MHCHRLTTTINHRIIDHQAINQTASGSVKHHPPIIAPPWPPSPAPGPGSAWSLALAVMPRRPRVGWFLAVGWFGARCTQFDPFKGPLKGLLEPGVLTKCYSGWFLGVVQWFIVVSSHWNHWTGWVQWFVSGWFSCFREAAWGVG